MPEHAHISKLPPARPLSVDSIYDSHAHFVWLTLQRMGIWASDLEDACQDVFIVVHRRLHTYDRAAKLTAWLFGICLKVAAAYRRRAHRRQEQLTSEEPPAVAHEGQSPEARAAANQFRQRMQTWLDRLDLEHRAVFVMFEIDGLPCDEIASQLGIPVGTVYSRLHHARRDLVAMAQGTKSKKRSTKPGRSR
ncbi:MAG: sigma-70 family RNA polymerase sigma factor [Deltaproteobacteria bacterium]|nr:sigma-70 family RNA polymerase sigma factor [Deltaproteobacteria bacterium]